MKPPCKWVDAAKGPAMIDFAPETVRESSKRATTVRGALPGFHYRNGYTFAATDLGNHGVKLELFHENDVAAAIILPPGAVHKCGRWLLQTLGQDRHGLPDGFSEVLRRLNEHKRTKPLLKRGDKKLIKDAIRVLRSRPV